MPVRDPSGIFSASQHEKLMTWCQQLGVTARAARVTMLYGPEPRAKNQILAQHLARNVPPPTRLEEGELS